jgi:RHS repeat-associated protein
VALGKQVYNSQGTLTIDEKYYDELMFSFGVPARISHGDGYVVLDKHGAVDGFYFYLKDHLGNVRSVITPGQNNQPEVVQANDYYPFGMSLSTAPGANKFMYNSKEEQEMPGKWLDYGFRFYDSQIARFHSIDPLATKNHRQTPYAYAMNNPIRYIDWLGLDTVSVNSTQPVKKDDVVVMDDGSNVTANADEVVVSPDGSSNRNQSGKEPEASYLDKAEISLPIPLPWYVGIGAVIEKSVIIRALSPLIFLTIPGDTPNRHKEDFAQHGKNRGTLGQEELEVLKAKSEAGTLSGVEKQKLKRHEKNTGERRSRQRKDKK